MKCELDIIYCIGDSHAGMFVGEDKLQPHWPNQLSNSIPIFKAFITGANTAYSLFNKKDKLDEILSTIPVGSKILLCYGEIDCRIHVLRQMRLQNKTMEEVINDIQSKYKEMILYIQLKGYEALLWGVTPSRWNYEMGDSDYAKYKEFPMEGNFRERLVIVSLWNSLLYRNFQDFKIINIFDDIVGKDYYLDAVHLSQKAMGYALNKIMRL
jgi:muconolactone delta-isomerase